MTKEKNNEKFFTDRDKTLLKLFFVTFLLSILVLNWNDLSWFMNVRTAPQLIRQNLSGVFFTERGGEDNGKVEEEDDNGDDEEEIDPAVYCEGNEITISAIDITAPVVEAGGTTEVEYREALDRGVIHFPGTAYPGEEGMSVLLGHSAPPGWPKINHDWVFTDIDDLKEGNEIEVCYNNILTVYTVIDEEEGKKIYEVGEDVPPLYSPEEQKKEIVIMSCWPPGSSDGRIGVRAVVK